MFCFSRNLFLSEDGKFGKRHQGAIVKVFNGKDIYYHSQRDRRSRIRIFWCVVRMLSRLIQRFGIRCFVSAAFHGFDYLSPHFVGARSIRIL